MIIYQSWNCSWRSIMGLTRRMVLKTWCYLCLFGLILTASSNIRAEDMPDPQELFQKVINSYQSVDYIGKMTMMFLGPGGRSSVSEAIVYRETPDKWRIEFIWPDEIKGRGMASVGEKRWPIKRERGTRDRRFMWHPPGRMLEEMPLKSIKLILRNYYIHILQGGSIAGRDTYMIELEPKEGGRPSRKIWVDKEKGVMLKIEHYDTQKRPVGFYTFSEIQYNPKIDESLFREPEDHDDRPLDRGPRRSERSELWDHGKGKLDIERITKEVELDLIIKAEIPAGFVLQSIESMKFGRHKNVHLKYTDGMVVVSVFQSRKRPPRPRDQDNPSPPRDDEMKDIKIDGVSGQEKQAGPVYILRWNYKKLDFTLIGELNKDSMIRIAKTLIKEAG
ncbi:DUF4367 domain-containing protein [Candidatus Poribacteria bacterium]|nr:DUF4367 domain-containing protein [Candidatus Poribacteria bacterium]